MSEKKLKAKLTLIKKPIVKKLSNFVGGNSFDHKKMVPNKDAYNKRQQIITSLNNNKPPIFIQKI